jgi:hypothetical protein
LLLLAGALLIPMALRTRIYHYGFALAMPATLMFIVALLGWFPRWLDRGGGSGAIFRYCALVILAIVVALHVRIVHQQLSTPKTWVGTGRDSFKADAGRAEPINDAVQQISSSVGLDQTVVAMPEGAMLNYLARRRNPTAFANFMPTEMEMFEESRILRSFQEHPPDFVVFVHKDTSEFGYRYFGTDYGQSLMNWIAGNYEATWLWGNWPLREKKFGILLMRRLGAATQPSSAASGPAAAEGRR